MRADKLIQTLTEVSLQWVYHIIYPNVDTYGRRRRDDVPWNGLIVMGDLGSLPGHECEVYDPKEGCVADGHDNYQFVAWIDYMGEPHYMSRG